jgi:hypothetical protein
MTLREFTDKRGVTWRVWDITPESLRELTGVAEYPAHLYRDELYRTGWLAFQSLSGTEKRSLSPIPPGWESLSGPELAELVDRAIRGVPRTSKREDVAPSAAAARSPAEKGARLGRVRAFLYPGGRAWTVCVATPAQGGPAVLRFSSGGRSLDLDKWPPEWATLPDEALIVLLRSVPRAQPVAGAGTPRRRWNDPRPAIPGP